MDLETYKKRAAEFREHMEKPMQPADTASVSALHEPAYLPGGYEKSTVPPPPCISEDLSWINPKCLKRRKRK